MDYLEKVRQTKIIAIVRGLDESKAVDLAAALNAGGIEMIEVTFNQARPETWADTCRAINRISRSLGNAVCVGAGTVMTVEQLRLARDADAEFMVSPDVNPEVIRAAKRMNMGTFPGAFTASEIVAAHEAGADAVKVFPAGNVGAGYIKALKAPLSHIELLAVGGINEENAFDFIQAGAIGVGVGGNLVNREWIEIGEYDRITALARTYRKAVDQTASLRVR